MIVPSAAKRGATVAAVALLVGLGFSGCAAKDSKASDATAVAAPITVDASDTDCTLSTSHSATGATTFIVTNSGTKVTEFYVYGDGDRVIGEVENISPGLKRELIVNLTQPGNYRTACKPGMVGAGITKDFVVSGAAVRIGDDAMAQQSVQDYKTYVVGQADALVPAAEAFAAAIKSGDVATAKALYPTTRTYWERIEPVAESFPDELDPRVDLREADLSPGAKWTGFHRLEKDLWVSGLRPDSGAVADQLVADVKELAAAVKASGWSIDVTQIAGGAQGLLDEVAATKITGEEDIFSHTDLWDFDANVEGSRTAVGSVRPIVEERNPELATRVDQRFADVEALLAKYRSGDGFVLYDTVAEAQRQELSRAIDALSKEVSQVQGVVAPR